MKKPIVLEVTVKQRYLLDEIPNGWTIKQCIDDWFHAHNINSAHATRDYHRVGGGDEVLDIQIVPFEKSFKKKNCEIPFEKKKKLC